MKNRTFAKIRGRVSDFFVYILLAALGILWVLPIGYLVYTAFRVTPSTGIINTLFPENLKLGIGNFSRLFSDTLFLRLFVRVDDVFYPDGQLRAFPTSVQTP